jgi:dolichol-phosphate mannosyltransferase
MRIEAVWSMRTVNRQETYTIMNVSPLRLSIVVPTFNESQNVQELLCRLEATLGATGWEVIFVDDDSPDGTAIEVRAIARIDSRIRCLQRVGRRGLASACIEGMLATAAPTIAVMDTDLQHDETVLQRMLAEIEQGGADLGSVRGMLLVEAQVTGTVVVRP